MNQLNKIQKMIKGLEILSKFESEGLDCLDHVIFVGDYETISAKMSSEDLELMSSLDWSETDGSWSFYF